MAARSRSSPHPPAPSGREGLGVTPPPPTQLQFPGGVTPRITSSFPLPPHQAEGNVGSPLEDSRFQILHCSGASAENNNPPGVLRPHPGGLRLVTPTRPPPVRSVWPMEELRMARPARAWQSPVVPGLDAWEDFVGRGGGERVLHPCQPLCFPGVAEPQRSQLAQRCGGLPVPYGSMRHSSA